MNQSNKYPQSFVFVLLLIVLASMTRFITHPFNFTAVGAIALFSGANFREKKYAFLMPVIVMLFTDLFLGFHFSLLPVYASFAFAVWIGIRIRDNQTIVSIVCGSLISSLVFFLVTNLPFWYADLQLYPLTLQGTLESYRMAIPFFKNQILGDLFYSSVLFGSYFLLFLKKRIPVFVKLK